MANRHSPGTNTRESVPDPRREALVPDFEVRLARELRSLLATKLNGPDDTSVALGSRSLSEIFGKRVPSQAISIEEARSTGCLQVGGFSAWPIFITYAGGHRDPYAPVYNIKEVESKLRGFLTSGPSAIRGGIGEAIRNVGQHGHAHPLVGYHRCSFAPAALFVKEFSIDTDGGRPHRALMAVIADEGSGISDPGRALVNGVGEIGGDDALGLGVELKSSLLYLVKSSKGEWSLFDTTRQTNPDKYDKENGFRTRAIGSHERIDRVSSLDLPAPPRGCQKILFFAHPSASAADVDDLRAKLLSALSAIQR